MRLTLTANDRARFWVKVKTAGDNDCWEWTAGRNHFGYGYIAIGGRRANGGKMHAAHRVSFIIANGAIPNDKPFILHTCDNPPCVNPAHLWAGTIADNNADKIRKGRAYTGDHSGEKNGAAQLDVERVRAIRKAAANGETGRSIAFRYGVSRALVSNIINRKAWTHI